MATRSSALRLFAPQVPPFSLKPTTPNRVFLTPKPPILVLYSPISFQRVTHPSPPKSHEAQGPPHVSDADVDPGLLPPKLLEIVRLFQSVTDPKAKYQQLLHYASKLPPMAAEFKTESNRVRGCVSQVWVRAFPDPDESGAVRLEADSDAVITRGLAALLVMGLSGYTAHVIAEVPPGFVQLLGLRQSLTPSRNNGFLNMLKLMQQKALEIDSRGTESSNLGVLDANSTERDRGSGESSIVNEVSEQKYPTLGQKIDGNEVFKQKDWISDQKIGGSGENLTSSEVLEQKDSVLGEKIDRFGANSVIKEVSGMNERPVWDNNSSFDWNGDRAVGSKAASSSGGCFGGRAERIRERLERELTPVKLEVEDISQLHAGHAAVRGSGDGETHFNVRVVSKEFEGKSMVKRHRLVYDLLQEELQSGLHALSIDAKTPEEVQVG